uniref:Ubiquitin-like protein 4A n=1 Tax=Callorhinchus milii TaxID=7868 RepID=V9L9Y2_CALMI
MLLTVKLMHGRECDLEVGEDEMVGAVKNLLAERMHVPVSQQRLLYKGKALSDERRLSDYGICVDTKLNLIVKVDRVSPGEERGRHQVSPGEERGRHQGSPGEERGGNRSVLWQQVTQILSHHFTLIDAGKVLEQLQKDYDRSLRLISLDAIERLATRMIHPEVPDLMEISFLD